MRVQFAGQLFPMTLELVDISAGGGSFRATGQHPAFGQRAAFGFVTSEHSICLARGRVVRVDGHGFAMTFERTNGAFKSFLGEVSGPVVCAA